MPIQSPDNPLIIARPEGLYCPAGDFYIDPWRPVARAIITHAHSDHARVGHGHYLATQAGEQVLRHRLGDIALQTLRYGEAVSHNGVRISLHPAGHVLGSAQVRIEVAGEVWVASGDYKVEPDPTCAAFEPVRCDTFITESTFGLPIYRWQHSDALFAEINQWWRANAAQGRVSVLFCYAFGKAQRILRGVDASIGPILTHGAVAPLNDAYRASGVALPATRRVAELAARGENKAAYAGALVLAPPSAAGSTWMRRFGDYSDAFASGWMLLRGARRRRGVERGFVMSDHADWPGLLWAIEQTGAQQVYVTHGQTGVLTRWLGEHGIAAHTFHTQYGDEDEGVGQQQDEATQAAAAPMDDAADSAHRAEQGPEEGAAP
ncbi:ligase-associated DNA damage response exonuclease [Andreprevotia sp. IGB-42]|uniref:ligase-associated DNA damage response exonuclease n=1 Tax=Andreprevotia sp. IGB-42 TaxID=2497473 RepID=UPI00135BF74B|nr:ligase-associated DNA damage response exonuclease [Andreprevotia sp. IGB-42]